MQRTHPSGFRLLPMLALCWATAATADVTWTGASQLGPYWHNALNWAGGQVPDSNDRALLGNADTFISQAQFARSFQGSGTLTVQSSGLGLYGPPGVGSLIGTLRLENTQLAGSESQVRTGGLWLQNAMLGDPLDSGGSALRADGAATIRGSLTVQPSWALRLSGPTSWAAGSGDLRFANGNARNQAALWVDATAVFTDHGDGGGTRTIDFFQAAVGNVTPLLRLDGVYRKAGGAGDTSIQLNLVAAGELAVQQGSVTLWGAQKFITGRLSTAAGATLHSPVATLNFVGARLTNDGVVQFGDVGLAGDALIDADTQWRGTGTLSVIGAPNLNSFSVITNHGSVQTGHLLLREYTQLLGTGSFETATLSILPASGSYVSIGTLSATQGPSISVSGTAVLGGQTLVWGGSQLALNGDSSWDSSSGDPGVIFVDDPSGGIVNGRHSRLSIGAAGVFRDEACTAPCDRSIQGPNRPGGELLIAGTYVKRGEHRSTLGSGLAFSNSGSIVAQQGQLRLYDVNNTGTLHADGGRIRVSGLAQWQPDTQTLRGGTYRVNSFGVIALELGSNAQPLRIRTNEATVLLDGPQATLLNRINDDTAVDAMAGLAEQRGTLHLTGGAQLLLGADGLQQSGMLLIGQGSRLRADGIFRQTAGATWLDGLLQAPQVVLNGGRFGAGDAEGIGQGTIEAAVWGLGASAVLDVDLSDATWDRIDSNGAMALAGSLDADFAITLAPGAQASYRVLSAAGGVTGSFASITHNLDSSQYQVWAEVGNNFVDLHISAVPEPDTWATTGAGLLALLWWSRRRGGARTVTAPTAKLTQARNVLGWVVFGLGAMCGLSQAQTLQGSTQPQPLTGIYRGDDGSALYLVQRSAEVFAFAEHPGKHYAFVARGSLNGNKITLDWWDIPKGSRQQQGAVELQVMQGSQRLQKIGGTDFGSSSLELISPSQVPWPVRKEAGFQSSGIRNVTGAYDGNDNSRWYIRATADNTVGVIEAAAQPGERPAFVSVFFGHKVPSTVSDFSGVWLDVPKGVQSHSGELEANLMKPTTAVWNREIRVKQTGAIRTSTIEPDYAVDFKAMGQRIEEVMGNSAAVGWAYAIATPAGIVKKGADGNRQLKVDGADRKFTTRTLAQAGSVSKTSTAIALAKALHGRNLPFNTPISFFLPPCWKAGKGIDASFSFGDLASHNTGFEDAGSSDYQMVKQVIENGNVRVPSGFEYRNANYRVMRYLVPLVAQRDKALAIFDKWDCKDSNGAKINDEISKLFAQILLEDTFPASVSSGMAFVPTSSDFSLNYNWQDRSVAGSPHNPKAVEKAGAGYLAQSAESAVMMVRALDGGEIVPVSWVRMMKQERYGFDNWYDTKAGPAAWKNGGVKNAATGHAFAAWVVVFPGRTYAYLVMNSGRKDPTTNDAANLGAILHSSYDAAFK